MFRLMKSQRSLEASVFGGPRFNELKLKHEGALGSQSPSR
jgi:hypothetical protein